jgi:hypothetical protein
MTHNVLVYPSTLPGESYERYAVVGMSLEQWLVKNVPSFTPGAEQPISATVNGVVVPPDQWAKTWITAATHVELRPEPKDPATLIIAAVAVVAAVAAVMLLKPSLPSQNSKSSRGSSIYEANAQGNKPKLGDVIPEIAGRHKTYPDYLTAPRRYFVNPTTQALDLLLCVGKGEYTIPDAAIKIGATPIASLGSDVDYRIYQPGENVTSHIAHQRWYNAPEVGASVGASGLRLKAGQNLTQSLTASAITFSGNSFTIPIGAGTPPTDWDVGMLLQVDIFKDVEVTDGGQDVSGNYLRDIVEGEFEEFDIGDAISIRGSDEIDGDYLVASFTAGTPNEMTLDNADSTPAAFLDLGFTLAAIDYTGVRYRIESLVMEDYETTEEQCTTNESGETTCTDVTVTKTRHIGFTVSRLNPDGSTDSAWPGFDTLTTSDAAITLDSSAISGDWAGPFLACPQGEVTSRIEWDVFAPQGLGYIKDNGDIQGRTRTVELQYRELGTTEWASVTQNVSGGTRNQLGWTFATNLPAAMTPEIRLRRTSGEDTSTQSMDRLEWYGLRCKLPHVSSYPGVTALAITLIGSDTIASQTENQVSVVATRRLPVRVDGEWQPAQATRDIAPWAAYVAKSVGYTDAEIDFDELDRLDNTWRARGDYFDFVTDDDSTVKESLNRALLAGMSELTVDAGRIRPVRDELRTEHEHEYSLGKVHGYSPQNMTGPLRRSVQAPRPDDADGVDVEYFSGETWTQETVECRLPGDAGFKAEKLRIEGVTSRTKAWQVGMRERRRMKYRRWSYRFDTELDALNSRYMSYCALLDDVPGYGQSALIEDIDGDVIRSSEPLEWAEGVSHVIAWRRPDGTLAGPYAATEGEDEYHVIADMGEWPEIDRRGELPHLYFGRVDEWSFPALVTDIKPQGFESVSVEAVNYSPEVYASDNDAPPV